MSFGVFLFFIILRNLYRVVVEHPLLPLPLRQRWLSSLLFGEGVEPGTCSPLAICHGISSRNGAASLLRARLSYY